MVSFFDILKVFILFLYNFEGFFVKVNKLFRELDKYYKFNKVILNE